MAIVTLGEGYHNYHHAFQHDYRNGVKPWQFDPTKWLIWSLSKLGLARKLRRVPKEKVALAELAEAQRAFQERLVTGAVPAKHCSAWASPPKRCRSSPISDNRRGASLGPAPGKEPNRS